MCYSNERNWKSVNNNYGMYDSTTWVVIFTILSREPPGLLTAYMLHPLVRSSLWSFRSNLFFTSFCTASGSNSDSLNTYILLSRPAQRAKLKRITNNRLPLRRHGQIRFSRKSIDFFYCLKSVTSFMGNKSEKRYRRR